MKILVLGGYGNFGARICRALAGDPSIQLLVGGRDTGRAEALACALERPFPRAASARRGVADSYGRPFSRASLRRCRGGRRRRWLAALTSPHQAGALELQDRDPDSESSALSFEAVYKADLFHGLSGSHRGRNDYVGIVDVKLTTLGEKAFRPRGSTFFLHFMNIHGGRPNHLIGAAQGVDNIEVQANTSKLYQSWYQRQAFGDRLSVLFGLYDLNSEFYVTESTAVFIHPALGIGSEMAQTGANGPPTFPNSSFGMRLRLQPTPALYAQAVVLDGVPGDPNAPHRQRIKFNKGDGALWVAETGYRTRWKSTIGRRF